MQSHFVRLGNFNVFNRIVLLIGTMGIKHFTGDRMGKGKGNTV